MVRVVNFTYTGITWNMGLWAWVWEIIFVALIKGVSAHLEWYYFPAGIMD